MGTKKVLARNCKECEYALSCCKNGFLYCNRADDPSFIFEVQDMRGTCLYDLPGARLSQSEIQKRDSAAAEQRLRFTDFLNNASRTVAQWPQWKREVLG